MFSFLSTFPHFYRTITLTYAQSMLIFMLIFDKLVKYLCSIINLSSIVFISERPSYIFLCVCSPVIFLKRFP